jgi:hypothetical protein
MRRPMSADEVRAEIAALEDEIEALAAAIEGCRKLALLAKTMIGGGALLLLALVVGILNFEPIAFMAGTAALLGGIVLLGSNNSTERQKTAMLKKAEARRADLIGAIDLTIVGERPALPAGGWLH